MAQHLSGQVVRRSAMKTDQGQVVPGQAKSGAGQLDCRQGRMDADPLRTKAVDKGAADAVEQGVAAGQDRHITGGQDGLDLG